MGILVINCDQLYEQPKSKCLPTSGKNFAHGVECAVQIPNLWGQPEKVVIMLANGLRNEQVLLEHYAIVATYL